MHRTYSSLKPTPPLSELHVSKMRLAQQSHAPCMLSGPGAWDLEIEWYGVAPPPVLNFWGHQEEIPSKKTLGSAAPLPSSISRPELSGQVAEENHRLCCAGYANTSLNIFHMDVPN